MSAAVRLALLGLPWDRSSSFVRGAAAAPPHVRAALWSPSTNSASELGPAIEPGALDDHGDLELGDDPAAARDAMERAVSAILASGAVPLVLGGDHSVTYPVLRAFARQRPASVLHLDAHGDLYDEFPAYAPDGASARLRPVPGQSDRFSHACPFARAMEEGLTGRLVQVGVRTQTAHLRAQAARFGVDVYGMDRWADVPIEALPGPVYVSLDLDGLDPAFAPGVAHPEPGGLATREVVSLLHRLRAPIAGGDIVELNPGLDVRDLTARVAAKLLKELAAVALRNGPVGAGR
ncbi:MAG: agmatinase family protein [Vicinamibacterales bacterium]